MSVSPSPGLALFNSTGFASWLQQQSVSLAFTTYQTNRLFFVGGQAGESLKLHERLFDKPMGLFAQGERLYMSTRYQLWQFDNLLAPGELRNGCDRLYFPKTAHTTGDLNVHDVVIDGNGDLLFVNTDFSCLARLSSDYSFEPLWRPAFISKLVAEDRCHLNGLALRDGQPAYMTACSATDTPAGWRDHRVDGGVAIDIQNNNMIATGLSMPHSPRWYNDKLWLLNSGTGEFGHVDFATQQFVPVTFCPGFVRGLAFWQNFAFVGLSKLRSKPFTGLVLEDRLNADHQTPQCGLMVIDLNTGEVIHWLQLEGVVEELFDVVVLPGVGQPQSLGFQSDEIERLVTFPGSDGVVVTKPTVKRPSVGGMAPVAGMPREIWEKESVQAPQAESVEVATPVPISSNPPKYQQVFHLNAENLADYEAFTYPSLQQRWRTQPQRGELLGTSASVDGDMVGFAIAELRPDRAAELISLFVAPAYRQQGVGTRLVAYLEQSLRREGCAQITVNYEPTAITQQSLEPLLHRLGWQPSRAVGNRKHAQKLFMLPDASPSAAPIPSTLKVSLVMTVYNTEAYLAEALDSLLAQTFNNWELILWDDGSSDGSVAIAQDYAQQDSRIRFHQGEHLGRVPALIAAHALTQGEYVGWLDADDRLAPTALEETVTFLDSHPDYGMVYTNYIDIDTEGNYKGLGHRCQLPYNPQRLLVDMATFHLRLLRQSIFAAIDGIRPEFVHAEDYDLCLRVSEVTQIHHLQRPLYFYRQNPAGLSQQNSLAQRQCSQQAVNDALTRRGITQTYELVINEASDHPQLQRRADAPLPAMAKAQFETGKRLASQGDLTAALASFNKATFAAPDYIAAYNQLGKVQQQLGQLDAAITTYQHLLLAINPNIAEAHCNLGSIWQIQGKTDEALAAYRKAIELKPDLAVAHQNLSNLLASLGQDDPIPIANVSDAP